MYASTALCKTWCEHDNISEKKKLNEFQGKRNQTTYHDEDWP